MTTFPDTGAWIAAFREAPDHRLGRILRHADSISPYQRGTARDAVQSTLKAHGNDEGDIARLDTSLAQWLEARLAETPDVVAAAGWSAYLDRVMEGFSLSIGLPLPQTGALLRDRYDSFETWTDAMSDEGPGDLYAAYVTALAHKQVNRRFLGLWFRLCSESGAGNRPPLYLALGQLGLRLLPTPDNRPPVDEGLEGLTRWAHHLTAGDEDRFRLQWRAFAAQHPRTPESWKQPVSERLAPYGNKPFAQWWRDELGLEQGIPNRPIRNLGKNDTDNLIKSLKSASEPTKIFPDVDEFVKKHENYALATESKNDLPKALNRVGNALLTLNHFESTKLAAHLAVTSLGHDPNDEPSWVLWAKALQEMGHREDAESVLWHAVERLPDRVHCRTVLSEMLVEWGRVAEAEALFRDTIRRFPNNEVAPTALAKLMADAGRTREAEALFHDIIRRFPDDKVAPNALAKLMADTGRTREAEALFRDIIRRFPDDKVAPNALAKLMADTGRTEEAEALFRDTMQRFPTDSVCRLDLGLLLIAWNRPVNDIAPLLQQLDNLDSKEAQILRKHLKTYQDGRPLARGSQGDGRVSSSPGRLGPEWELWRNEGKALHAKFLLSGALDERALILSTMQDRTTLKEQALEILRHAMERMPNNPVVRLIAQRYGKAELPPLSTSDARRVAGRDFALRLELALQDQDTQALSWLREDFPDADQRTLTACAWLLLDPNAEDSREAEDAARGLQAWLHAEPPGGTVPAFGTVHRELRRRLRPYALTGTIDDFLEGWNDVSPKDVRHLIDIGLLGMALAAVPSTLYELLTA